jgi:NTP pyrophosphatase (non-canonical NTP hydrolase)
MNWTEDKIAEGLTAIMNREARVQLQTPWALNPTPDNLRMFALAWIREVGELLDEFPRWKEWKRPKEVDKLRLVDEFADCLAFMGLFLGYAEAHGVTPEDIATAFVSKSITNELRLAGKVDGYGVDADKLTAELP